MPILTPQKVPADNSKVNPTKGAATKADAGNNTTVADTKTTAAPQKTVLSRLSGILPLKKQTSVTKPGQTETNKEHPTSTSASTTTKPTTNTAAKSPATKQTTAATATKSVSAKTVTSDTATPPAKPPRISKKIYTQTALDEILNQLPADEKKRIQDQFKKKTYIRSSRKIEDTTLEAEKALKVVVEAKRKAEEEEKIRLEAEAKAKAWNIPSIDASFMFSVMTKLSENTAELLKRHETLIVAATVFAMTATLLLILTYGAIANPAIALWLAPLAPNALVAVTTLTGVIAGAAAVTTVASAVMQSKTAFSSCMSVLFPAPSGAQLAKAADAANQDLSKPTSSMMTAGGK